MLCLAIYCAGIAFISCLAPWEGYDEIAHYSYAQQLADTGEPPSYPEGRLSLDVERYRLSNPVPYSTTPPFDDNKGLTYRHWFADSDARHNLPHEAPDARREFSPGHDINWQSQHPALYYWLIAPVLALTADLSWVAQLFWLRIASWSLAFVGLVIGVATTCHAVRGFYPGAETDFMRMAVAWPLLFPGLFPEFARLGNDGLVVLLFAFVWACLVRRVIMPVSYWWYMGVGTLLGLGGMTKVTFLPVTTVVLVWLAWLGIREPTARKCTHALAGTCVCMVIFLAIAGRFYLANLIDRGSLSGLVELSDMPVARSFPWLLAFHYPLQIIKGLLNMGLTFVWGATASSAYPPAITVMPMILLSGLLICAVFHDAAGRSALVILAASLVVGVFISLLYYLLIKIAATGMGSGVPGWYFHTLMAPLCLLLALGLHALRQRFSHVMTLWRLCLVYGGCFVLAVSWLQLSLFTGCTFKTANSRMYSSDNWNCLLDFSNLYRGLALLGYPAIGLLFLALAVALVWTGGIKANER